MVSRQLRFDPLEQRRMLAGDYNLDARVDGEDFLCGKDGSARRRPRTPAPMATAAA